MSMELRNTYFSFHLFPINCLDKYILHVDYIKIALLSTVGDTRLVEKSL